MTNKGLFGLWFYLLAVGFLVWPCLAQVPKAAQCLVSGNYSLLRLPDSEDESSCWNNCSAEPDCHVAVVAKPLGGSDQCLLVNCLNQGKYSYRRDPSTQIMVYPKSTNDSEQRESLMTGAIAAVDKRLYCFNSMKYSSCRSGIPKFFYNSNTYRCERFYSGCGSNRNTFDTKEGCEAVCNEMFRCYRPMQNGVGSSHMPKFFYNVSSQRCESFIFRGHGSNGNIFDTAEECGRLCDDVKAPTTSQPAVDIDTTATVPTDSTGTSSPVTSDAKAPTTSPLAVDIAPTTSQPVVDIDTTATVPTDSTGTSSSVTSDAKAPTTSQPAVDIAATTSPPTVDSDTTATALEDTATLSIVIIVLLVCALIVFMLRRSCPSPIRWLSLKDRDEYTYFAIEGKPELDKD